MTDPRQGAPVAAVIMAAGLGTRMRSATPKHFHLLLGRRMVDWVVALFFLYADRPGRTAKQ